MSDSNASQAETYNYVIMVDDNFHYRDEDERYMHSKHDDPAVALQTAKDIVDTCLGELHTPGMTAEALYDAYTSFGDDPFIQTKDPTFKRFSAWTYARERCSVICPP